MLFEPGATGGAFVGVLFDDDSTDPEVSVGGCVGVGTKNRSVRITLLLLRRLTRRAHIHVCPKELEFIAREAMALHSARIYGGFIFMAGGSLQFKFCFFWDFEIITPLDRIYLGGDVLVGAYACVNDDRLSMVVPHSPLLSYFPLLPQTNQ